MPEELTIEDAIEAVLEEAVENAVEGDVLHGASVKEDFEQLTKTDEYGFLIGDCVSDVAPGVGGVMGEYDALFILVAYARVTGTDKTKRRAARRKVRALMLKGAQLFSLDPMMGGRVRDSQVLRCRRGFDSLTSADVHAVAHIPLLVNATGQQIDLEGRMYE